VNSLYTAALREIMEAEDRKVLALFRDIIAKMRPPMTPLVPLGPEAAAALGAAAGDDLRTEGGTPRFLH
jgi:hypothetical protein